MTTQNMQFDIEYLNKGIYKINHQMPEELYRFFLKAYNIKYKNNINIYKFVKRLLRDKERYSHAPEIIYAYNICVLCIIQGLYKNTDLNYDDKALNKQIMSYWNKYKKIIEY